MGTIKNQLEIRLKKSFKVYIMNALEHALCEVTSESHVLQVIINMQAALELLSKFFVLQHEGWKGIVDNRFHDKSEIEILSLIKSGKIKTTAYWKNKDFISQEIYLNEDDKWLLDKFQEHRNQIMHLGMLNPSHDILNESIWLMVRIINQLNWQDTLPMRDQYLANSLESLIGDDLYEKLLNNSCYVGEAVDRAHELYPDDIKHCLQCANESWALNDKEYRVCMVCGYRGDEDTFGFTDCPLCKAEGAVVFDALNIGDNEYIKGKCCSCREYILVRECKKCHVISKYPSDCSFCVDQVK